MSKGKEYNRMIHSARWLRLRRDMLTRHPLCQRCETDGHVKAATEVHHIRPVEDAVGIIEMESRMFDPHNLQCLCHSCHVEAHKEMGKTGRVQNKRRTASQLTMLRKKFLE